MFADSCIWGCFWRRYFWVRASCRRQYSGDLALNASRRCCVDRLRWSCHASQPADRQLGKWSSCNPHTSKLMLDPSSQGPHERSGARCSSLGSRFIGRFCCRRSGILAKPSTPSCLGGVGGSVPLQKTHRDLKKPLGTSLNGSGGAIYELNVKGWLWCPLPYAWLRTFSLSAFFFALFLLVCVKGCYKAARHNKPSAQLTGASAETFTYDIVKLLCNQSLLIWDTIAFSGPKAAEETTAESFI